MKFIYDWSLQTVGSKKVLKSINSKHTGRRIFKNLLVQRILICKNDRYGLQSLFGTCGYERRQRNKDPIIVSQVAEMVKVDGFVDWTEKSSSFKRDHEKVDL